MGWGNNVHSNPEKFDLVVVDEIDYSSGSYEFDYRTVWKHTITGKVYTARDSGCSCPSPFQDYTSLADLAEVEDTNWLRDEIAEDRRDYSSFSVGDGQKFIERVGEAVEEWRKKRVS